MRLDHLQFIDICRDIDCPREELHRPHAVKRAKRATAQPSVVHVSKRRLVVDMTLAAVSDRIPKMFNQIYTDVLDDYGSVSARNVYGAIAELRASREVALIVPAGSQAVVHKHGIHGAYLRYDSPLLWNRTDLRDLMEQVYDMIDNAGDRRNADEAYA